MRKPSARQILLSATAVVTLAAILFATRQGGGHSAAIDTAKELPAPASLSYTDKKIKEAETIIERLPASAQGYNLLCAAYIQKARETGDFGYTARSEAALNRSLEVEKDNYEAMRLKAALLLSYHRFAEALELARHAAKLRPRDPIPYGAMTDALVELGDYEAAREAAEKMLALRPDTASYSRASYIRSLHGDGAGAIEMMRAAIRYVSPNDPETMAWCRVHLGDELFNEGDRASAEREYDLALAAFPEYPLALTAKARARIGGGDMESALALYRRAQQIVPLPDTAIALGDLYASLGRAEEMSRQHALIEAIGRAGGGGAATYSRQQALYWANHDERLDEALSIARRERSARADIFTSDVLAWCLYKNGKLEEARAAIEEALRLGTRDAQIRYHAGMIFMALGEGARGEKYLREALQINPFFDLLQARVARRVLEEGQQRGSND